MKDLNKLLKLLKDNKIYTTISYTSSGIEIRFVGKTACFDNHGNYIKGE